MYFFQLLEEQASLASFLQGMRHQPWSDTTAFREGTVLKRIDSYLDFSRDLRGFYRILALVQEQLDVNSTHELVDWLKKQNDDARGYEPTAVTHPVAEAELGVISSSTSLRGFEADEAGEAPVSATTPVME